MTSVNKHVPKPKALYQFQAGSCPHVQPNNKVQHWESMPDGEHSESHSLLHVLVTYALLE